ncbi:hypothetical protein KAFR_0B05380 [Kazachstania africana CBS 2517]|uniref:AB hydrolase-1 domain-containing protein n=1 Tax=Kazachstania africana (strain ATCC 22294 / BCRC 22015 / CBS 2517 / CECT 1963 / NBRC 1671 / NRRL Y-8276) TaxID=1071382 RepID=H2AR33_KAZAF|nr:hypothetical protein KAFR_0B05380 [Kazachstania africana CBS 2517]CCF56833.1 hypothetical protein KAFR_0B05380 [Kazachstania africana CBS 2517]
MGGTVLRGKLLRKIFRPAPVENSLSLSSTLSLWASHLGSESKSKARLRDFQDAIMKKVPSYAEKSNVITSEGLNQWHFHNSKCRNVTVPTLLLHGFASSSMSFFRNFTGLSQDIMDLYAIDLPANGLSRSLSTKFYRVSPKETRKFDMLDDIHFQLLSHGNYHAEKELIQKCEDYYIDTIERWRRSNELHKINIVAHSFGGYLSFKYALKYPESINKLCLVSPLGVEANIYSINNNFNVGETYTVNRLDPSSCCYINENEIPKYVFDNLFKILRLSGPIGAKLCWNYVLSSYSRISSLDFKRYVFELLYGKGGMTATAINLFTQLFTTRLLARDPLMDSAHSLSCNGILLLYGEYDWMAKNAGKSLLTNCKADNKGSASKTKYLEVPKSGHNLFLDNPAFFNKSIAEFLSE